MSNSEILLALVAQITANFKGKTPQPEATTEPDTPDKPLTPDQQKFAAENYELALRTARNVARRMKAALLEDIVENAAVNALITVARRSTSSDFRPETGRNLLLVYVRTSVQNTLRTWFGRLRPNEPNQATATDGMVLVPDKRFPCPVQAAIQREEETIMEPTLRRVRSIIGQLADIRKSDGSPNEFRILTDLAKKLGVGALVPANELRERIAARVRAILLKKSTPTSTDDLVPETVLRRVAWVQSAAARRQQEAEKFVRAWMKSRSIAGAARRLGHSIQWTKKYADQLRRIGVQLPELPVTISPVAQVIELAPSRN